MQLRWGRCSRATEIPRIPGLPTAAREERSTCIAACVPACLSVCLLVGMLVCLCAWLSVCLFVCLLVCLVVCLVVCLLVCLLVSVLFVCLSMLVFVCLNGCLQTAYLPIHLPDCAFLAMSDRIVALCICLNGLPFFCMTDLSECACLQFTCLQFTHLQALSCISSKLTIEPTRHHIHAVR